MDNITFNEIPVDIRTPGQYIEIDNSNAVNGIPVQQRRILIMGQKLAAGTGTVLTPYQISSKSAAEELAGRGSIAHLMAAAALDANANTNLWLILVNDDGAAVDAAGTLTFSGAVTSAGTLHLYVAGRLIKIAVAASEASATTAANVAAAINAKTDLPISAAVNGGDNTVVDLTARNGGECGNDIDVRVNYQTGEFLPKGLVVDISALAGGSGNPDITTILTVIDDEHYHSFVTPWTDTTNMAALETELGTRFTALVNISGHAYAGVNANHAGLTTYGSARNSAHSSVIGINNSPTPPWIWASVFGNVAHYYLGIDPARPLQTLSLPGVSAPIETDRFNRNERDLLLHDGISTFTVDQGGNVFIERAITTYQTNAASVEDTSYLDINTVETVNYIRYAVAARIALQFPRFKLADDGTRSNPGQSVATPSLIRGELISLFRDLEDAGIVENFDQFKDDLIVVRSTSDPNRINCVFPPDLVNQFRVFAAAVRFEL